MKYRIAKKKLKKNVLLNLWFKSDNDWCKALENISKKYPKNTDPNNYNDIDRASYVIGCDMLRYDWNQALIVAEKIGFGYRTVNKYYNDCYA